MAHNRLTPLVIQYHAGTDNYPPMLMKPRGAPAVAYVILIAGLAGCAFSSHAPRPASQNPSPMQEQTRRHERIPGGPSDGTSFYISDILPKPVSVFVAPSLGASKEFGLLVHFHGAAFVVNTAVSRLDQPMVGVSVNLGAGSSVYERPFLDESVFPALLAVVGDSLVARGVSNRVPNRVFLSAFSAGYGAVRAILRHDSEKVAGVLLLDGFHTDYVPDGLVLFEGGTLGTEKLTPFVDFARLAVDGSKRMVITHSEIFPGTFASTTEATDYLIEQLGLTREPVVDWGPGGMQLLSRTREGGLTILGFAGNTAPDHVDHLHGLPEFLRILVDS